jgi:hypothetical protein
MTTSGLSPSAKAVYLRGDPEEPGPIPRGRLRLERDGLHFTDPGGANMLIALEELRAVTVTGRRPEGIPGRTPHGTLRLASQHNGSVAVWEFAVDRPAAAELRDRIGHLLASMRRPALPFVEQLLGIDEGEAPSGDVNGHPPNGNGAARAGTSSFHQVEPEPNGDRSTPRSAIVKRRRWLLIGGVIGVFAAAEVILPLVLAR